jgi:site-specific DNA-methyltransferase (adenine-specific)
MLEIDKIYCGDCLELMPLIPDKSIDMILCDLPYGTTACKWDHVIPFEPLWKEYKRLIKDRSAIVLTASQPFTSMVVINNLKMFKYSLCWDKGYGSDFQLANIKPLKAHEDILVFGNNVIKYNPQKQKRSMPLDASNWKFETKRNPESHNQFASKEITSNKVFTEKYPISVLKFNSSMAEYNHTKRLHPTQKPVALFEYLIKTYTNEGDLVLDNCIGSGTTAIACINTNRHFIGIEKEQKYVDIANKRIKEMPIPLEKFIG